MAEQTFVEARFLIAVMEDDYPTIIQLLDDMLPGEKRRMATQARAMATWLENDGG
jgi:hypothetical protein